PPAEVEHRPVDRPPVGGRVGKLSLEDEGAGERVGGRVLQHVHAVVGVLAVVGGDVDVPLAAEEVKLGRPQPLAGRAGFGGRPDDLPLAGREAGEGVGADQGDVVPGGDGQVVPAVGVPVDPRVGAVGEERVEEVADLGPRVRPVEAGGGEDRERSGEPGQPGQPAGGHASSALTTLAGSTPVSRWSRPWYLNVNLLWSIPSRCRTVAWKSWTWTGSLTML